MVWKHFRGGIEPAPPIHAHAHRASLLANLKRSRFSDYLLHTSVPFLKETRDVTRQLNLWKCFTHMCNWIFLSCVLQIINKTGCYTTAWNSDMSRTYVWLFNKHYLFWLTTLSTRCNRLQEFIQSKQTTDRRLGFRENRSTLYIFTYRAVLLRIWNWIACVYLPWIK